MKKLSVMYIFLIFALMIFISACGDNEKASEKLKKEYEVMDRKEVKKDLQSEVDSLKKILEAKKDSLKLIENQK